MQTTDATCLNLNEAFHRYQGQGVVRNVQPRARVCIQGHSARIVKVLLLVDYKTAYWDPSLASAYAVAATFVMDRVSEHSYQAIVNRAVGKHGRGSPHQSYRAQLAALCEAVGHGGAVCIQRDEQILSVLAANSTESVPNIAAALDRILAASMYDQNSQITGVSGTFSSEQIGWLVRDTLAVGQTTFTAQRFAWEADAGEHAGWRFENATQAA